MSSLYFYHFFFGISSKRGLWSRFRFLGPRPHRFTSAPRAPRVLNSVDSAHCGGKMSCKERLRGAALFSKCSFPFFASFKPF